MSGIPEIIKCGIIDNIKILSILKKNKNKLANRNYNFLSKLIKLTLTTKIKFFKNDVYENSDRLNLNFGHTFAHAIEMSLKGKKIDLIRHGEAVGIGMLCEIYYTEGKSKIYKMIKDILDLYKLPQNLLFLNKRDKNDIKKNIFKNIFLDKKKIGKYPRIIKIEKIGKSKIFEMKNNDKIKKTIQEVLF